MKWEESIRTLLKESIDNINAKFSLSIDVDLANRSIENIINEISPKYSINYINMFNYNNSFLKNEYSISFSPYIIHCTIENILFNNLIRVVISKLFHIFIGQRENYAFVELGVIIYKLLNVVLQEKYKRLYLKNIIDVKAKENIFY